MPESTQVMFKFTELAELLVKKQGLHEGYWGIVVKFGISAANIAVGGNPLLPTAIVPIVEIGIQRETEPTPLNVNAAEVNPSPDSKYVRQRKAKIARKH
jgi:hypothetical protein